MNWTQAKTIPIFVCCFHIPHWVRWSYKIDIKDGIKSKICHLIAYIISILISAKQLKFNLGETGGLVESAAICPNSNQENLFEKFKLGEKCPPKTTLKGDFFYVLYSSLLHLPPLIFHCVRMGSNSMLWLWQCQSDALTTLLDLRHTCTRPNVIQIRLDLVSHACIRPNVIHTRPPSSARSHPHMAGSHS